MAFTYNVPQIAPINIPAPTFDPQKQLAALERYNAQTLARASRGGGGGGAGAGSVGMVPVAVPDPTSPDGYRTVLAPKGTTEKERQQIAAAQRQYQANALLQSDPVVRAKLEKFYTTHAAEKANILDDLRKNDFPRLIKASALPSAEIFETALSPLQQQLSEEQAAIKDASGVWDSLAIAGGSLMDAVAGGFESPEERRLRAQKRRETNQAIIESNPYLRNEALRKAQDGDFWSDPNTSLLGSIAQSAAEQAPVVGAAIGGGGAGRAGGTLIGFTLGGPVGAAIGGTIGQIAGTVAPMALMEQQHLAERIEANPNLTPEQQTQAIAEGLPGAAAVGGAMGLVPFGVGRLGQAARGVVNRNLTRVATADAIAANLARQGATAAEVTAARNAALARGPGLVPAATAQAAQNVVQSGATAPGALGLLQRAVQPRQTWLGRYALQGYPRMATELSAMSAIGVPGMNLVYEQATGQQTPLTEGLPEALESALIGAIPFGLAHARAPKGGAKSAKIATAKAGDSPQTPTASTPSVRETRADITEAARSLRATKNVTKKTAENWVKLQRENGRTVEWVDEVAGRLPKKQAERIRKANEAYSKSTEEAQPAAAERPVVIEQPPAAERPVVIEQPPAAERTAVTDTRAATKPAGITPEELRRAFEINTDTQGGADAATATEPSTRSGAAPDVSAMGPVDPAGKTAVDAADIISNRGMEPRPARVVDPLAGRSDAAPVGDYKPVESGRTGWTPEPGQRQIETPDAFVETTGVRSAGRADTGSSTGAATVADAATGTRAGGVTSPGIGAAGGARDAASTGATVVVKPTHLGSAPRAKNWGVFDAATGELIEGSLTKTRAVARGKEIAAQRREAVETVDITSPGVESWAYAMAGEPTPRGRGEFTQLPELSYETAALNFMDLARTNIKKLDKRAPLLLKTKTISEAQTKAMDLLWKEALHTEGLGEAPTSAEASMLKALHSKYDIPELQLPPTVKDNYRLAQRLGVETDARAIAEAAVESEATFRKVFNEQFTPPC